MGASTWTTSSHLRSQAEGDEKRVLHTKPGLGNTKRVQSGDFPGGPVVKKPLAIQGTWVQPLVREPRSHMLSTATEPEGALEPKPQLESPCATTRDPCAAAKTQ